MNTCTRRTEFAKQSTVVLALWVSIVARVSMFMLDDRILQNFCWMPEGK